MLARRALLPCAVAAALAACGDARVTEKASSAAGCSRCHGGADNAAPPVSALGATATTDRAVGAHQQHLRSGFLRGPIACEECHVVPATVEEHVDGRATVAFGPLATAHALSPSWDREAGTCAATWCHGGGLPAAGGTNTAPVWTRVAQGQTHCGTCHGAPPPPPHPSNPACARCHPDSVRANGMVDAAGGRHLDGTRDVPALTCTACHGSEANAAPPIASTGAESTSAVEVGAHQAHLRTGAIRAALACADCHAVPSEMLHADGTVDLAFGALAGAVTWDRGAATCATYCHGATLDAGGTNTLPVWTEVGAGQTACGTCHGAPPPPPHPASAECRRCHPDTIAASGAIDVAGGRHVNGALEVTLACTSCHGSDANPAPPISTAGEVATTAVSVGAHQAHLTGGAIRAALACSDCHAVPSELLHADGTVDLAWSALAGAVTWDRGAATCSTYCHGATLDAGGTNTLPVWTRVGEGQAACGTCHGSPPPAPHPPASGCSGCHRGTVTAEGAIDLAGGQHVDGIVQLAGIACSSCHGSEANPAPPLSTTGESATTAVSVGAHQAHVTGGAIRAALACSTCHPMPSALLHSDGAVDLAWSPLAGAVVWDRAAATCSTYCHGATLLAGGTNTLPVWTRVGQGQAACGTCHASPPPAPHPSSPDCARCHPDTVTAAGAIDVAAGRHVNGTVDLGPLGCATCHGSEANPAPPLSTAGESATTAVSVGAHQAHVTGGAIRAALACGDCHAVPSELLHADGTVDLAWSALAGAVTWDRGAATCASTYCHGATLDAGGTNTLPVWTSVGTGQAACGTCHGAPPPAPHPANPDCARCHPETVDAQGDIDLLLGRHVDGALQVGALGCAMCHGSEANAAPPISTSGAEATTDLAVGAHQSHVTTGSVRAALGCDACHAVPTSLLHADGTVDLAWSALAGDVAWDRAAATCSTYCHGATLDAGGTNTLPVWTRVGEGQTACGACHGAPPPLPHPPAATCDGCHAGTVGADGGILVAGGQHVDGILQLSGGGCSGCHGSEANPAPPLSTTGESATTAIAVGAHQPHVTGGSIRSALACSDCHAMPSTLLHADGTVDLRWSALAGDVAWERGAATCSTYCHGATLDAGGTNTLPVWTLVGVGQAACGTCHASPPPLPHPPLEACAVCHPDTVAEDGTVLVAGGRHVNGVVDASAACGACHGVPPASGAHRAHAAFDDPGVPQYGDLRVLEDFAPEGGPAYRFGCGHCHPVDPARHMDGALDVDLSPAGAAGLRARNAADAAYAPETGTCAGVYCHSSGQAAPAYAATPGWASGARTGCADCHGNPPAYASGGAGAADANGHIGLTDRGREFGHYAGMAGPSHLQKHGGGAWDTAQGAAPITCQTCHFETADAATTGPSGFYWLDTRGAYALPGGDPTRADDPAWRATQCATCHSASGPAPAGSGRVRPLRHVNGRRDVAFDPRTALPPYGALPAPPDRPSRPYWVTGARFCEPLPPDAVLEGTTLSLHLAGASWDPTTKSCSGVACHLGGTPVWGRPYRSSVAAPEASCCGCHASRCGP